MKELRSLVTEGDYQKAIMDEMIQVAEFVLNGDIETPHALVQSREGDAEADFWHGIIHRMEGDSANAKYWFRRSQVLWRELGLDPIALTNERNENEEAHEWRVLTIHGLKRLGLDVI